MLDIMERRVTRSISNELQARVAQAQAQQSASNSYMVQNSYHMHIHQQQQHQLHSGGHGQQQHQYPPSNSGMNHHHYQQQQQQAVVGMTNVGGMGGNSMGGVPLATYPRTTSEEMFLNTLMNTPLSPGTPTMEAGSLGFLEPPQTQRGNSEELFNSWIATSAPESSNQYQNKVHSGPSPTGNRPRQNTRRVSSELQAIISQQNGWAPRTDNVEQLPHLQTNSYLSDDIMSNISSDPKPYRGNSAEDKSRLADFGAAGSLKDMWYSSTSPMTRSRSSELRRKFAKLDGLSTTPSADVFQKLATQGTLEGLVNHPPMSSMGTFALGPIGNNESHHDDQRSRPMGGPQVAQVATIGSTAPVNHKQQLQPQPPAATNSGLSDVVGLLKGSLERKKMQTKQQQQASQEGTRSRSQEPLQPGVRSRSSQEPPQPEVRNNRSTQELPQPGVMGMPTPMSSAQVNGHRQVDCLNRSQDHMQHIHSDSGLAQSGQLQPQNSLGRAHSPDESSCGVLSHSTGMANSDGPSNSAVSVHRQALKRSSGAVVDQPSPKRQAFSGIGGPSNRENCENGATKASSLQKPDQLTRASSVTSSLRTGFKLNEIDGATRKRRVERQRKMAEAKVRGNVPPMPADMQAFVKRCDALEKEVRSLKLNLSFMNRKDSEQTKRIEELEQQNQELKEERERLLEELDRVSPTHDPQ